jgi:hypothetical protein
MTEGASAFQPTEDGVTVRPAEDEVTVQPTADEVTAPFRSRGAYTGYRAFGSGDGAVLMAPSVARDLRSAAELATATRRITGGLLYGRGWADEMGTYLVIDHYLEAGSGESSGVGIAGDGDSDFTLAEAGLRVLREDAAAMYSGALEVGWWRSRAALGEFGPKDFATQGELVGPDGVGLLVYGSGVYWGTAYLGPVGLAPDSAGTLAAVQDPDPGPPPGPGPAPTAAAGAGLAGVIAGEGLEREPILAEAAPPRRRVRRRTAAPGYGRARRRGASAAYGYGRTRRRGAGLADGSAPEPAGELPADAQLVVGALIAVVIAAAIIIGFLASSVLVAVIIGAVGVLLVMSTVWMSHRY